MGNNDSFVFYGSWLEAIEGYREDFGDEYADELVKTIVYYGITGEIISNKKSIIGYINGNVAPLINKSKERYKKACQNGEKGGRKRILEGKDNEIKEMRAAGYTAIQIGEKFGVSEKTVRRSEGWIEADKTDKTDKIQEDNCPDNCPDGQNLYKYQYQYKQKEDQSVLPSDFPTDDLLKNGWTYEQLIYGFKQKEPGEWHKHGYGLFYKKVFQEQVQKKMKEEEIKEAEIDKQREEMDNYVKRFMEKEPIVIKYDPKVLKERNKKKRLIDLDSLEESCAGTAELKS